MDLTQQVKDFAISHGADMVGIAPAERLRGAPDGTRPQDLLPGCRSIVVAGMRIPAGTMRKLHNVSYLEFGYYGLENELNSHAYKLALFLEDKGYPTMPSPAGRDITTFSVLQEQPEPRVFVGGSFSLRHAAVAAGLGGIGMNSCIVTPRFGSRVRVVAVLTTAELRPDDVIPNPCVPEVCHMPCVRVCPAEALPGDGTIDHFRCLCMNPKKADPQRALATIKERFKGPPLVLAAKMLSFAGTAPHICAKCLAYCPAGRMKNPS